MPEVYYLIPMVAGPYSRENPQRPDFVDEIRCNWTGHNVDELGVYVCLVNTTAAKHADLASRTGVRQLPSGVTWSTVISTLTSAQRTAISNWCSAHSIPYASTETVGQLLVRVISSGLFSLGTTTLTTQYQNLTQARKDKITAVCARLGIAQPTATETVRQIVNRVGPIVWPGNDRAKVQVGEF
jgi:hypothetical protein